MVMGSISNSHKKSEGRNIYEKCVIADILIYIYTVDTLNIYVN